MLVHLLFGVVNMTSFISDISRGDSWYGRKCCSIPYSENCRRTCITATSLDDLTKGCRRSDEIAFFNCLEYQKGRLKEFIFEQN